MRTCYGFCRRDHQWPFSYPSETGSEAFTGKLIARSRAQWPFDKGRGRPGGWWILDEPELHLGSHILVPDLAGWRRTRLPSLPKTAWFELAPDWVCEVLSPGTAADDRAEKLPIYAEYGVVYAWLIDPQLRTLEPFENNAGKWHLLTTLNDQGRVSLSPFDAIAFDLSLLWAD